MKETGQQAKQQAGSPPPIPASAKADEGIVVAQSATTDVVAQFTEEQVLAALMETAGQGTDYAARELAIPYLKILQSNNPEVKEEHEKYIEGAKPGMILNTVTGKVFDIRCLTGKPDPEGIPVLFGDKCTKKDTEWRPDRGGFVAQHAPGSVATKEGVNSEGKKVRVTAQGTELVETDYHYPLVLTDPTAPKWALMAMASSQLKNSRELNSLVNDFAATGPKGKFKPAIFSMVFELRTKIERAKGADHTWWGWDIRFVGLIDTKMFGASTMQVIQASQAYHKAIRSGLANIAPPASDVAAGESQEVPF